jgi:hypothetical protein
MASSKLGFIIDQGLSPIDSKPYVAILTLKSSNRKTGDMAQVWILRSDINPVEALNTGEDYSICGNCPHRKGANELIDGVLRYIVSDKRSCYVNVGQAPNSVYKSFKAGRYDIATSSELKRVLAGRRVRWGAYGDPAILHESVVSEINGYVLGHTGYTHQWRESFSDWCKGVFQASCDGMMDYLEASKRGYKTFAVIPKGSRNYSGKQCPATIELSEAQCKTCKLCDGAKADIYVEAHGGGAKYVVAA